MLLIILYNITTEHYPTQNPIALSFRLISLKGLFKQYINLNTRKKNKYIN